MVEDSLSLVIIGHFPDSFELSAVLKSVSASSDIYFNEKKYAGFDRYEISVNGMAFELQQFGMFETQKLLKQSIVSSIFGSPADCQSKSIGVWLGDHLKSGKHMPTINRALLNVGKLVGQAVSATHIGWLPAHQSIDFEHFAVSVDDYLDGGPTPILLQIAIKKSDDQELRTLGLNYFANQEVVLVPAPGMIESEAIKRLVRICHDIAVNGRIETELETDGLHEGEKICFKPNADRSNLAITISSLKG